MSELEAKNELREMLAQILELEVNELGDDDHLIDEHGLDSIGGFEVVAKIQKKFGIPINDSQIPSLTSINKIFAIIGGN